MADVDELERAEEHVAQTAEQVERERRQREQEEIAAPPIKGTGERDTEIRLIPLREIGPGRNIRRSDGYANIHSLALSIRQRGLRSALLVRPTKSGSEHPYELVVGFRRYAALKLLPDQGTREVRCEVDEALTDAEVIELQLLENAQREPLKPLEVARALRSILDQNPDTSLADLARSLGLRPDWVRRHFRMLELPADVQERLDRGDLSFTIADILRRATKRGEIVDAEASSIAQQVAAGEVAHADVKQRFAEPSRQAAGDREQSADATEGAAKSTDDDQRRRDLIRQADAILVQAEAIRLPTASDVSRGEATAAAGTDLVPYRPIDQHTEPALTDEQAPRPDFGALNDDQLVAYLLGRLLRDSAPTALLVELNAPRGDTYSWALAKTVSERQQVLIRLARELAELDSRFPRDVFGC